MERDVVRELRLALADRGSAAMSIPGRARRSLATFTALTALALLAATPACHRSDATETPAPVDGGAGAPASARSLRRAPSPVDGVARELGRRGGAAKGACNGAAAGPSAFGLYVLALSWAPAFCTGHPDKEECSPLSDFASTHLTLHGLWPNYDDAESARSGCEYPQYCGASSRCSRDDGGDDGSDLCSLDRNAMPADMKIYGPGYVGDDDLLAAHEWPKHGSCTGLPQRSYFEAALRAMTAVGGDHGTPSALADAIGSTISPAALVASFAHPESILLACDARCELTEVGVCLAHDGNGTPGAPVACPQNVRTSTYDRLGVPGRRVPSLRALGMLHERAAPVTLGAGPSRSRATLARDAAIDSRDVPSRSPHRVRSGEAVEHGTAAATRAARATGRRRSPRRHDDRPSEAGAR